VHLVGFIIRIYHDARSSECQTLKLDLRFLYKILTRIDKTTEKEVRKSCRKVPNKNLHILVCNSNKMHKSQTLFNLTTALHVSGVTITHLQENKTTVTTASGNRYTVLLSTAVVEELELI
jgi:hypothetical protein